MRGQIFICLLGTVACGSAHAEDATAICKASMAAYETATANGDAVKLAAVFAPDGELVGPYGVVHGRDALIKTFASYLKAGDKDEDTLTSAHMLGDTVLCTGGYAYTPAAAGSTDEKGFWTKVAGKVGDDWKILNLTYAPAAKQ
ncbi:MAG: nuclear transport factor 2 family protein [Hyphomicrobiales bacterium]|jgi:ketosteroid isomerase-like protein|nr:nuclear transport factor 2 family protein [Hyphomicrobiales bacterium]